MNKSRDVLAVGRGVLAGKLAEREGKTDEAIATLTSAVAKEDALSYSEPPDWWYPVRHVLGDALLAANRPAEAEQVYRADLAQHPKNGFALFGLSRALAAEKKVGRGRPGPRRVRGGVDRRPTARSPRVGCRSSTRPPAPPGGRRRSVDAPRHAIAGIFARPGADNRGFAFHARSLR